MTFSKDLKKPTSIMALIVAIIAYSAVFIIMTVSIGSLFWNIKISNNFLSSNQIFLGQLIGYWLAGLVLLLITPRKYRDLGYRTLLVVVVLMTAYYELPSIVMWRDDAGLWYNFLWSVLVVVGLLMHLSLYLLSFSVIEYLFKSGIEKPILAKKKVIIALVVITLVTILATISFHFLG